MPLSKVPEHVQDAVLAAEDRNFYQNNGISPDRHRAAPSGRRCAGGPTQGGGSTITQQYVKNYFLTQDRTLTRKAKEILISVKIDQQQSKDQILENYLNTIYYGRGAYGIQTASKAYFDKDVSQLTVGEGAAAGVGHPRPVALRPRARRRAEGQPQGPRRTTCSTAWSGRGLAHAGRPRQGHVPDDISPKAKQRPGRGPERLHHRARPQELRSKLKLTDADIDRGGLRIITTINKQAQDAAVDGGAGQHARRPGHPTLHAGLAAIKPGDGAVVAMYGGKDYTKVQLNSATAGDDAGRLDVQAVRA